ncbi:MAG: gliding motility-associated C-terminal domain-containing protein, partial [Bacteroidia bacterium]|nr:gliding motility-associated C-terminal domain-containing protein [Bacteroidia bacterium]
MKTCFIIFLLITQTAISQNPDIKRTWHWYFGAGAGLDFSSGTPVADTTAVLHTYESSAVMSDTAGNLLFYTDGDTVWDNNHAILTTGLLGCGNNDNSAAQGALIVPHPGNDSLYYIFTSDCFENQGQNGYRYTLIDIKNKQVLQKNILLYTPSTEGMAVTKHANGIDYWLVTHEYNSNKFIVYKIDDTLGLTTIPIINLSPYVNKDYNTYLKFNHKGSILTSLITTNIRNLVVASFDKNTGDIHSYFTLGNKIGFPIGYYAMEFSINDSFLYCTTSSSNDIFSYKFSIPTDSSNITNTWAWLKNTNDSAESYGQIQCSPMKNIIIAKLFSNKLTSIDTSNNIIVDNISLKNKFCNLGLPNFISSYFRLNNNDNTPSVEPSYTLAIPNIFTPNNDHTNDFFSIQISGYSSLEYSIYNRWGQLLHAGKKELNPHTPTTEILWNGKLKNEDAPTGTYYYLIKAYTQNQEPTIKK